MSRVVSCGFRMFGFNRVVPLDWLMVAGVCLEKSHRVHIDEREKTHTAPYHESEGLGSTYVTRLGFFFFHTPGHGTAGRLPCGSVITRKSPTLGRGDNPRTRRSRRGSWRRRMNRVREM